MKESAKKKSKKSEESEVEAGGEESVTAELTTSDGEVIDFSGYLPAGYRAEDLQETGGLTPLVPAEYAYREGVIVAGWIIAIVTMPPRPSLKERGKKEDWDTILVQLTRGCKAVASDEEVDVPAGGYVMIPVNGNLRVNSDLMRAAKDPTRIYFGVFQVTGTKDVGQGSEMWAYKVFLHPNHRERVGAELLNAPKPPEALPQANGTASATSATE